jgi:uncharacterized protein YjbI with pentapeptide repeats
MKHRRWLHTLSGLLAGLILVQRLAQRREPEPDQSRQATSAAPGGKRRLTREDLLRMIEKNGGPEGLDLSGRDLSWLDLSSEALEAAMEQRSATKGSEVPAWVSPFTWGRTLIGLNFHGVDLRGANLQRANLRGADLTRADLRQADLRDARLQAANLHHADCRSARLWRVDLRRASAGFADFRGASLYRVQFEDSNMVGANLANALLESGDLSEVRLNRRSIGSHILQEKPDRYSDYLRWDDPELTEDEWDMYFVHRLERAREIYAELRSSFLKHGFYDDASWAHFKERSLERQMHQSCQAKLYYGDELPENATLLSWRWWWFYLKHTARWVLLWGAELSCGYGEKPLRSIGWALAVVLIFPVFYWLSGGIVSTNSRPLSALDYLNYSLGSFTTIGFARFNTANWIAETLTSLEALLGISVLALLMFALGNRISRS